MITNDPPAPPNTANLEDAVIALLPGLPKYLLSMQLTLEFNKAPRVKTEAYSEASILAPTISQEWIWNGTKFKEAP